MNDLSSLLPVLIYAVGALISMIVAVAGYVAYALGLFRICNKVGQRRAPLAWVPVAQLILVPVTADGIMQPGQEKKTGLARHAVISLLAGVASALLCAVLGGIGLLLETAKLSGALIWIVIALLFIALLAALACLVYFTVVYILAFYRIARMFVPTWACWTLTVALVLNLQMSALVLLILSFFPFSEPAPAPAPAPAQAQEQTV